LVGDHVKKFITSFFSTESNFTWQLNVKGFQQIKV